LNCHTSFPLGSISTAGFCVIDITSVLPLGIRTAATINDAIRNGAQMHEVREFAGHADIRTTELYFVRKGEDGEMAARRIQIRVVESASAAIRR